MHAVAMAWSEISTTIMVKQHYMITFTKGNVLGKIGRGGVRLPNIFQRVIYIYIINGLHKYWSVIGHNEVT